MGEEKGEAGGIYMIWAQSKEKIFITFEWLQATVLKFLHMQGAVSSGQLIDTWRLIQSFNIHLGIVSSLLLLAHSY